MIANEKRWYVAIKDYNWSHKTPGSPTSDDTLNLTHEELNTSEVERIEDLWERSVTHCGPEAWSIIAQYTIENIIKVSIFHLMQ